MLKFFSSILCTSKMHPFSLGNYLGTSLIIGILMIIKVTTIEWNMVRVRVASCLVCCPCTQVIEYHQYVDAKRHA